MHALDPGLVEEIRKATNGNYALGGSSFADQIAAVLGRRSSRQARLSPPVARSGIRGSEISRLVPVDRGADGWSVPVEQGQSPSGP